MKTQDGEGYIHGNELRKNWTTLCLLKTVNTQLALMINPTFTLMQKLKIIQQKNRYGPANLIIADIPTPLFIPFGFFPLQDNEPGFLMPNYGYSVNRGYNPQMVVGILLLMST